MTVSIAVSNFRGCARAQYECAPIALIAGLNGAGKTSIAQGVGAVLAGIAVPVGGLGGRTNLGVFVHAGAASASVTVRTPQGTASMEWPEGRRTASGIAPEASEYATGLLSIATLPLKDRLRVLAEYLHAEPTRDDLAAALTEQELGVDIVINAIWGLIEQHGWDPAHALRKDKGAELKGQWRQVTGANYGSRIAAQWRPDLAELNEGELIAELRKAETARDRAIAAAAVTDEERRRLEEEAQLYDPRVDALTRARARVDEYETVYHRAQDARAALPPVPGLETTIPCPYCGEPIVVRKVSIAETRFEKAETANLDDAEVRRRRTAIAEADGKLSNANGELQQARREVTAGETAVRDSLEARERLANWPRAVESGTDLEAAKAAIARADKRLQEWRAKVEADDLHAKIEANERVLDILAPDGLRATKMARVIETFSGTTLADLSETAGWAATAIDPAGTLTYAGRPYPLLSTSEQYRLRAVLQIAMAQIEGAALIVLDGADVLDPPSRSGLFAMLDRAAMPALVCMTLGRREQVPDLAAAGLGRSYWLAGGEIEPLGVSAAAA